MSRHATNHNLTLHYENTYLEFPIQVGKGPFISEYLQRLHETTTRALDQYPRVFAFRFDLRLPSDHGYQKIPSGNEVIDRFIESFKAKIRHNRTLAFRKNKYAHDTVVRYVWAREASGHGLPHFHFAILLNYDAFCAIGKFEPGRDNMFNRLQEAWASALGLPVNEARGLVHVPENASYRICQSDDKSVASFFYRTSYLCKAATKVFGDGYHGFGASRI